MSLTAVIPEATAANPRCPSCESEALYKYGKTRTGRQRFLCLMCGMQFTPDSRRAYAKGKPTCPLCGRQMNLYLVEYPIIRFRCSGYPQCRQYRKFRMTEESG